MGTKTGKSETSKTAAGRENRLKAALKANLQRRKAQAKARKQAENKEG